MPEGLDIVLVVVGVSLAIIVGPALVLKIAEIAHDKMYVSNKNDKRDDGSSKR